MCSCLVVIVNRRMAQHSEYHHDNLRRRRGQPHQKPCEMTRMRHFADWRRVATWYQRYPSPVQSRLGNIGYICCLIPLSQKKAIVERIALNWRPITRQDSIFVKYFPEGTSRYLYIEAHQDVGCNEVTEHEFTLYRFVAS